MSFDPLSAAFEMGTEAIKRIWPDPIDQAREQNKLTELKQKGDLAQLNAHVQLMLSQIKVNEVAAKHPSIFVSGARPFIIWVGGVSMAWSGLIHPMLVWVWAFAEMTGKAPPMIESAALASVVTGLLGVATMRSYDKTKGNSKDSL